MRLISRRAISLFVCPPTAGGFGLGGANAQIPFTPNISTQVLTQTVEGPGLGAVLVAIDVTGILKAAAVIGAIVAVAGGGAICGGSIVGRDAADEDRQQVEQNIIVASRDAIYEFQDLERNPPE